MISIINKVFLIFGTLLLITIHILLAMNCNEHHLKIPLKQCCRIPNLISKSISQTCKKYKEQIQLPDANINKTILRNQKQGNRRLASCYMECVFNETGIIQNDDLRILKVKSHLAEVLHNKLDFLPLSYQAFEICSFRVKKMIEEMSDNAALLPPSPQLNNLSIPQCSPHSNMIMNCVISEIFLNCPNSSWTNSTNCINTREYMALCPHTDPHYGPPRN